MMEGVVRQRGGDVTAAPGPDVLQAVVGGVVVADHHAEAGAAHGEQRRQAGDGVLPAVPVEQIRDVRD